MQMKLTDNKIGDEGVKAVCDGLMMNTGLTELELQSQEFITVIGNTLLLVDE